VRYNEVYAPTIPMRHPFYSNTGYRFRYNYFERDDKYALIHHLENVFFDYFEYNTDVFETFPKGKDNIIAEQYFRLEVDQITHTREVYSFMQFIGDLGGVQGILIQIAGWIIGSYSVFHASFATVSALYRVKDNDEIFIHSKSNS
jgi:hypothetical protein